MTVEKRYCYQDRFAKKMISLLMLIAVLSPLIAQNEENPVDALENNFRVHLVANWVVGDVLHLEVTSRRRDLRLGKLENDDTIITRYTVTVIEESDSTYTIKWMPVILSPGNKNRLPDMESFSSLLTDFSDGLIIKTSKSGEFISLENGESLIVYVQTLFQDLADKAKGTPNGEAIQQLIDAVQSPQVIEQKLLTHIHLYYQLYGMSIPIDQPFDYQQDLPNNLDGSPIPVTGTIIATIPDSMEHIAVYRDSLAADEKTMMEFMKNFLNQIVKAAGEEIPEEFKLLKAKMNQLTVIRINHLLGDVIDLHYSRNFDMGISGRIDDIFIKKLSENY